MRSVLRTVPLLKGLTCLISTERYVLCWRPKSSCTEVAANYGTAERIVGRAMPSDGSLEDTGAASKALFVLLEFPAADNAQAWMSDPELKSVHEMRRGGAKTTLRLIKTM